MKNPLLLLLFLACSVFSAVGQVPDWEWARGAGEIGVPSALSHALTTDISGNAYLAGEFVGDSINFDSITLKNTGASHGGSAFPTRVY